MPDDAVVVTDLADAAELLPTLARWHFDYWGRLTGAPTLDGYVAMLTEAAKSRMVPSVLVALAGGELLGSANLVACDLPPRPEFTPWLAQLFVAAAHRRGAVGAALVAATRERAKTCGYARLYLYTSGTLPDYYARLGWRDIERLTYLGRERTVMDYDLGA
jgi:GNAT superfamily N-acetyltransferase